MSRLAGMLCALLCGSVLGSAGTIYVDDDAPPGGSGTSWLTPFKHLQDALAVAVADDEIRVGQGIYRPDRDAGQPSGSGDRYATFALASGVALRGGYAGYGAAEPDARDIALYETILSGDLLGDDEAGFVNYGENSYHVLVAYGVDASAILDGVTVTAGNADGADIPDDAGGGMRHGGSQATVTYCRFERNRATWGGAIESHGSESVLDHCTFVENHANNGGAVNVLGGGPVLQDCGFTQNTAGDGGALATRGINLLYLERCTFTQNQATNIGGGLATWDRSSTELSSCVFVGNSAQWGGAAFSNGNAVNAFTDCQFQQNTASAAGGGMRNDNSTTSFAGCTFTGNTAEDGGAVSGAYGGSLELGQCQFEQNQATNRGGALVNWDQGSPVLQTCTFVGNAAAWGGAAFLVGQNTPDFVDCDFVGNTATEAGGVVRNDGSEVSFADCTFTDNSAADGGALSSAYDGSFLLEGCSLSQNHATNRGGALANWDDGSPTLNACSFSANTAATGGAAFLVGQNPPNLIDCVFEQNTASSAGGAVRCENGQAAFTGCSFRENEASDGAGLSMAWSASATLERCEFEGNVAANGGGAVSCVGAIQAMLVSCIFTGNHAAEAGGGGLLADGTTATVTNCEFNGNSAVWHGGAIKTIGCWVDIANSTFAHNSAASGGAIECWHTSDVRVDNCVLYTNSGVEGSQIALRDNGDQQPGLTVRYSDVQGGAAGVWVDPDCTLVWGDGNLAADPHFEDALGPDGIAGTSDDDLRLAAGSPCIDAGNNAAVPPDVLDLDEDVVVSEALPWDLAGEVRFLDIPGWADTGNGDPPVVDMGAYESRFAFQKGDLNCDGLVSFRDINPFVLALTNWGQYLVEYPFCDILMADTNCDGYVTFGDINPFVGCVVNGGCECP